MIPFLGGAENAPILCKARLGTGFSARTQRRPYTHGRIFLAGGRFEPELFSRPRSACLCGCNGPTLELGRAGWLTEAWPRVRNRDQTRKFQNGNVAPISEWSRSPNWPALRGPANGAIGGADFRTEPQPQLAALLTELLKQACRVPSSLLRTGAQQATCPATNP
jgi:hypothetical protein